MNAHDAEIIRVYLSDVERGLSGARKALDEGDAMALGKHLRDVAYAARMAQARAEQAAMLAAE